jgi:hypothetical protein
VLIEALELNIWNKKVAKVRHSEEWFSALYRNMPLPEALEPEDCHGPDDDFLRTLASPSRKPSPFDPRVKHVAGCSRCLRKLRLLQKEVEENRVSRTYLPMWAWALAIMLIVFCISAYLYRRPDAEQSAIVAETLNLSDYGTTRGSSATAPVVKLPRRDVKVTIILPRLSDPGPYAVDVLETKQASISAAHGYGKAVQQGSQTLLTVNLDLHTAKPGLYYLSTTHGTDEASYYYPLEVVR